MVDPADVFDTLFGKPKEETNAPQVRPATHAPREGAGAAHKGP
jgi:hypothetical protein